MTVLAINPIAWLRGRPLADEAGPLAAFMLRRFAVGSLSVTLVAVLARWPGGRPWLGLFLLLLGGYGASYLLLALLRRWQGVAPPLPWLVAGLSLGALGGSWLGLAGFERLASTNMHRLISGEQAYLTALVMTLVMTVPELMRDGRRAVERREQAAREVRVRLEKALLEAELRTLQAQVEPHFLYNTLANVQYLTRHDPALAGQMVSRLIGYLRLALPELRGPASTVGREMALAEHYLHIMALRMGGRLRYRCHCPEALIERPMPPLMLISLVENAIKHGIEPRPGPGEVVVTVSADANRLLLEVEDDGVGLREGEMGSGVGLRNIRQRLQGLYGGLAGFDLRSRPEGGVLAYLHWPDGSGV